MTAARVEELRQRVIRMYAGEDQDGPEAWWRGTCDSVCAILEEEGVLADFHDLGPSVVKWGAFGRRADDVADFHCFVLLADGTIVDPTSRQFGLEQCAVIPPDDPRQAWYRHDRASTDADSSEGAAPSPGSARSRLDESRVGGRSAGTVSAT